MQYKFATDDLSHARAALLLYAMYKSRNKNSPLNGLETWDRAASFIKGACLKSNTTGEFVEEFCRKAKIDSIRPCYLGTEDPVLILETGELILSSEFRDYRLEILEDNKILKLFNREALYIIMLVRERIQREKVMLGDEADEETDEI